MPPPAWVLELLGTPRLRAHAQAVPPAAAREHPLSRKDAAWLLLVAVDAPVASRRVAAAVWPGREPALALTNLRQRVFRLRRQTGARLLDMGETLSLQADLALDPAVGRLLQWRSPFGTAAIGGPHDASDAVPAAGLDRDWLAGFDYPDLPAVARRLRGLRDRWDDLRVARWLGEADRQEAAGAVPAALQAVRSALAVRPLDEALHRRLIGLHLACGDHAAAATAFEALARALHDELGIRPSGATQALLHPLGRVR